MNESRDSRLTDQIHAKAPDGSVPTQEESC